MPLRGNMDAEFLVICPCLKYSFEDIDSRDAGF